MFSKMALKRIEMLAPSIGGGGGGGGGGGEYSSNYELMQFV